MKKIIALLVLAVMGCKKKDDIAPVLHQICSSEYCSDEGAMELMDLYQNKIMTQKILTFRINCIVATNKKSDHFKIPQTISNLNKVFEPAHIRFKVHSKTAYEPQSLNIDEIAEKDGIFTLFKENLKKEKSINIIIVPHGYYLNGYTLVLPDKFLNYLNLGYETMYISDKAWFNGSTLQHELGHFFGLQHTFGKLPAENTTLEHPNKSNCKSQGDFICDTPADPNGKTDKNCNYIGTTTRKGQKFSPHINNYMSYYPNACKNEFTKGQYEAMNFFAKEYRSYLLYQQL